MGYCRNCGTELKGGEKECPACGIVQEKDALNGRKQKGYGEKADMAFDSEDIRENKAMAALAYLGALVAVPLFFAKDSRFARFHGTVSGICCLQCGAWSAQNFIAGIFLGDLLSASGFENGRHGIWRFVRYGNSECDERRGEGAAGGGKVEVTEKVIVR